MSLVCSIVIFTKSPCLLCEKPLLCVPRLYARKVIPGPDPTELASIAGAATPKTRIAEIRRAANLSFLTFSLSFYYFSDAIVAEKGGDADLHGFYSSMGMVLPLFKSIF